MPPLTIRDAINLAAQQQRAGRMADAQRICQQIMAEAPNNDAVSYAVGLLARERGDLAVALDLVGRAVHLKSNVPQYQAELGEIYRRLGKLDDAQRHLRKSIDLEPGFAEAHNNLGLVLSSQGNLVGAEQIYRRAIELRPNYAIAYTNLGHLLLRSLRFAEAIGAFDRAVQSDPQMPQAHAGRANALFMANRPDESMESYQTAIALGGTDAMIHNNLAHALRAQGRLDECIEEYERAAQLQPDYAVADSNRIYALLFDPKCSAQTLTAQMARWNQRHGLPLTRSIQRHRNQPDPDRRLRIGYVSPYFFAHAESFFVAPLLKAHDHRQFEIFCYSNSFHTDAITEQLRASADGWRNIGALSDAQAAEQIRKDGIDILIDLAMHMAQNRLLTFAQKPAPIQAGWLAYPGGTGLEAMDYRITDAFIDPPGVSPEPPVEQPIRLPDCWCCYDPLCDLAASGPRQDGPICFGSLNNPCKLNAPLLELWGQVMRAVPQARLLIQVISGRHREQVRSSFVDMGISDQRLEMLPSMSRPDYMRAYSRIDICLDTLPYNGITTTCDALWMAVPVISLTGKTAAGRAGQSILSNVGLAELATQTPDQFVSVAANLAGDRPRLTHWRGNLRRIMEQSPLMDAVRFCRNMEAAYRGMWRTWCAGKSG